MARAAAARVRENHDIHRYVEEFAGLLHSVLAVRPSTANR
jgi:hypothetical protein